MLQGDNIQAASTILNQVIDDNVLEQKKKMVTDIYIANKLNNEALNSVQIATLNPIAHELGVYGGDATYTARALLNISVNEEDNSEFRISNHTHEFYTHGKPGKVLLNHINYIYPNPASNELNFDLQNFSQIPGTSTYIKVTDVLNKMVRILKLENGVKNLKINTTDFQSGIYFVYLISNDIKVQSDKIVIIH